MTVALVLLLFASACKKEQSPDGAFWRWFSAHAREVATVKRADEPIADQLAAELHKIDPRLTFELGVSMEPHELIISAGGLRAAFPTVKRLVSAAPPIAGWSVIAFRPRKENSTIELGNGLKLRREDLSFVVLPSSHQGTKIDIELYAPGIGSADDMSVKEAGYLLLDSALGEYDVETKLGVIDWKPSAAKPPSARPFRDLPAVVDGWK